jgi:hypothetical protein
MRRCEHCGKQYADKVAVCPIDGQPTINPQEQPRSVSSSGIGLAAFNAKVVSPMSAAGSYRIFVQGSDLVFIQIEGGANSVLNAIVPFLGPAGGVLTLIAWLFSKRKAKDFQEKLQSDAPENLLRDSEKNFRLHLAEIREAVIKPPPTLITSGKETGRATLSIRHNEMLELVFATREDLDAAWQLLASALASALQVDLEWNEAKQRYQKIARQKH